MSGSAHRHRRRAAGWAAALALVMSAPLQTRADEEPAAAGRLPIRERAPATREDYVINLMSSRDPIPTSSLEAAAGGSGLAVYVSDIVVDGVTWHRLRLGFFASEAAAAAVLAGLRERFPRAWIGRAGPDEGQAAQTSVGAGGLMPAASPAASPRPANAFGREAAGAAAPAILPEPDPDSTVAADPERVVARLAEARSAGLDGDFAAAIAVYEDLLRSRGPHRHEALEFLGVSYEKIGRPGDAAAAYRLYLESPPSPGDAARVRQRLNGLVTASAAPAPPRAPLDSEGARTGTGAGWSFGAGVSSYYRRVDEETEGAESRTLLSALINDVDLGFERESDRVDVIGRFALSSFHDLAAEDRTGQTADQNRVYRAYVDIDPSSQRWWMRLGRQSLHHYGVLGRFDGAHFAYEWRADRRVLFTAGHPVESARHGVRSERRFEGIAIDFDELVGRWDLGVFLSRQSIEGIDDRQAAGVELAYLDEQRSLSTIIDYDVEYSQLNTALALGTWRIGRRVALTGLAERRATPVVTTRNALIGQPVTSIRELLELHTEDEIRQLALDRTAASTTFSLGISTALSPRFQLNADVTMSEIDATVASGGVGATPSDGQHIVYAATFVGSGLIRRGDINVWSVRRGSNDRYASEQVTWEARLPLGRRLRLGPRLRYAVWTGAAAGAERTTLSPSLRLLFASRGRYRFELEIGSSDVERIDGAGDTRTRSNFVNIGYLADF